MHAFGLYYIAAYQNHELDPVKYPALPEADTVYRFLRDFGEEVNDPEFRYGLALAGGALHTFNFLRYGQRSPDLNWDLLMRAKWELYGLSFGLIPAPLELSIPTEYMTRERFNPVILQSLCADGPYPIYVSQYLNPAQRCLDIHYDLPAGCAPVKSVAELRGMIKIRKLDLFNKYASYLNGAEVSAEAPPEPKAMRRLINLDD